MTESGKDMLNQSNSLTFFGTVGTIDGLGARDGGVDVHESAIESFVDFGGPEGAVEMHPLVRVHVEETPFAVGGSVTARRTQHANTTILHRKRRLRVAEREGEM